MVKCFLLPLVFPEHAMLTTFDWAVIAYIGSASVFLHTTSDAFLLACLCMLHHSNRTSWGKNSSAHSTCCFIYAFDYKLCIHALYGPASYVVEPCQRRSSLVVDINICEAGLTKIEAINAILVFILRQAMNNSICPRVIYKKLMKLLQLTATHQFDNNHPEIRQKEI